MPGGQTLVLNKRESRVLLSVLAAQWAVMGWEKGTKDGGPVVADFEDDALCICTITCRISCVMVFFSKYLVRYWSAFIGPR